MMFKKKYLLIFILFIYFLIVFDSYCNKVHAQEVYSGQISPTIARLRQIGAPNVSPDANIDASFSKNIAHIRLSGDNVNTSTTLSVFFNTLSYFGWKGYHYKFAGYLNNHNNAYSTITGVDIANGAGDIIGVCDYQANGNETQYQSFTLDCMVPSGLTNGSYANIIDFQFATLGNTPANITNFDIYISSNMAVYKLDDVSKQIQEQQQQQHQDSQAINQGIQDTNTTLTDDNIDNSSADNLTNNDAFKDENGLDAIIKSPLNFIKNLTNSTCSPINISFPHTNINFNIPCMSSVYKSFLPDELLNVISLVVNGAICYRYCLKLLQMLHDAKNPNKDELEVMDL